MLKRVGLSQPPNGSATSVEEALEIANEIGFPVLIRPSYVLGGRGMEIIHDDESLLGYMREAVIVSGEISRGCDRNRCGRYL
jgi:carbamoyl-phosphate synthase large subunit